MNNHASASALDLAPLRKQSVVFLVALTIVLPALVIISMLAFPSSGQTPIAMAAAAAVVAVVAGGLAIAIRRRSIALESDTLVMRATIYTRRIALGDIRLDDARVLDLREHPEQRPLLKTNGVAVPGLAAGNFRDRNRDRLFCLVTGPRVVILPLADGSRVLVSPLHPELLLQAIRERAGGGGR